MVADPSQAQPPSRTPLSLGSVGFLLGSGLLLTLFLMAIGRSHNWWHEGLELEFLSRDASGISRGMDVRIAGFKVGRVQSVTLEPDARVRVRLEIRNSYAAMLGPGSQAELGQVGVVGSPYVAVSADPSSGNRPPLRSGSRIPFHSRPDLDDLLVDLAQTRIPLDRALRSAVVLGEQRLPRTLNGLEQTLAQARRSTSQLQQEAVLTAAAARNTLTRGDQTLAQASRTLQGGDQLLSGPGRGSLASTLTELRRMATATEAMANRTEALVQRINGSWLLPLLDSGDKGTDRSGNPAKP